MAPEDWLVGAVTTVAGLLIGLSTGFFFESRQTRRARSERDELREANVTLTAEVSDLKDQLRRLNVNLTSTRRPSSPTSAASRDEADETGLTQLASQVREYVAFHLDASGTVPRGRIFEHFTKTHPSTSVERALATLVDTGALDVLDGNRIRIRT